jgi:4-hydroxy-tetrahydrodipicolinate reductase
VVAHSTASSLAAVLPQLLDCVRRGFHVVSTCEELSYPWTAAPELAAQLDKAAKEHGVAVLGTGVNPGFAMDYLPIALSGASVSVTGVRVHRVQDAGMRRVPLQRKVGATLTVEQFQERVAAGTVRHVGLPESAQAVAAAFGWKLGSLQDEIAPLVAGEPTPSALGVIAPGQVTGVHQVVTGHDTDGNEVIRLTLDMAVGLPEPRDEVELRGVPGTRMVIPGGLHGDIATSAVATNCLTRVPDSAAGLRVMADIAPPHP